MVKTNAMRLLTQAKIPFRCAEYDYDENDLSGCKAAAAIGMPAEQVFKTLVAQGASHNTYVFCIPVCCELDLKKAAKASGEKNIHLVLVRELLELTGYIRGGCSPIGMKKAYPTFIDETAELFSEIGVSAGTRGQQILLDPEALITYTNMTVCDLTAD